MASETPGAIGDVAVEATNVFFAEYARRRHMRDREVVGSCVVAVTDDGRRVSTGCIGAGARRVFAYRAVR